MKNKFKVIFVAVSALAVLGFSIFLPAQSVHADDTQPTKGPWRQTLEPIRATVQALPTQDPMYLSNLLKREQLALNNQAVRLEKSEEVADTTQTYINEQKGKGKDTSNLESALSTYRAAIASANSYHAEAESTLAHPAGFNSNGNVADLETARQTVHSASQSLRQAHVTMTNASLTLRQALQDYRLANNAQ